MTLQQIKESDAAFLYPKDIAEVLHCNPNGIRAAARDNPEMLGFKVTRIGTTTYIPRKPFLEYIGEA